VRTPHRDDLQKTLQRRGIQTGIHYPVPVHLQPAYTNLGYKVGSFPISEKVAQEVLSLPIYAELTEEQIVTVSTAVKEGLDV